ncbi:hypothetical protein [Chryseobacterium joostei]|uniref:hypothetical protein n=1 Tax=Chryseobacterium joostei TaxID=112234 RepID=UPI003D0C60CA
MDKKSIALCQIISGARLFNEKDYISCITLCGAAEEVLGKISQKENGINQYDYRLYGLENLYRFLGAEIPNKQELNKTVNLSKNELKHNDKGENTIINCDFENEAAILFIDSVKNYYNCFNEYPNNNTVISLFEYLTL